MCSSLWYNATSSELCKRYNVYCSELCKYYNVYTEEVLYSATKKCGSKLQRNLFYFNKKNVGYWRLLLCRERIKHKIANIFNVNRFIITHPKLSYPTNAKQKNVQHYFYPVKLSWLKNDKRLTALVIPQWIIIWYNYTNLSWFIDFLSVFYGAVVISYYSYSSLCHTLHYRFRLNIHCYNIHTYIRHTQNTDPFSLVSLMFHTLTTKT